MMERFIINCRGRDDERNVELNLYQKQTAFEPTSSHLHYHSVHLAH